MFFVYVCWVLSSILFKFFGCDAKPRKRKAKSETKEVLEKKGGWGVGCYVLFLLLF